MDSVSYLDCLNRTSVGLKHAIGNKQTISEREPQSNQRGIETSSSSFPTSNLSRLNRTSVGLKPRPKGMMLVEEPSPQSNQRGIETGGFEDGRLSFVAGLNRTSVGLKQLTPASADIDLTRPQSNQRGIETSPSRRRPPAERLASIEPAWD